MNLVLTPYQHKELGHYVVFIRYNDYFQGETVSRLPCKKTQVYGTYIVAHLGLLCESKCPTISHFNVISHNNGFSVFSVYVNSFVAALQ